MSRPPCPACLSARSVKDGFSAPVACEFGRVRQRFRCVECGRRFNDNVDSFYFNLRKNNTHLNAQILGLNQHGLSNRSIASLVHVSEHCVRGRLKRLAQRALEFQWEKLQCLNGIREPVVIDGLENFAGSQYDPNNINQAIGYDSLFIYDYNYVGLNRKGRMSDWQKNRLKEIVKERGRYKPSAIRHGFSELVKQVYELLPKDQKRLELYSDEHFQYKRALRRELSKLNIEHKTVNSKECRNFQNILFPVNHADLMIRHLVKSYTRETIAFNKTAGAMSQRYVLYMVTKNYMRPQFTKKLKSEPLGHVQSPAQALGLTDKVLKFGDIFDKRPTEHGMKKLRPAWQEFWHGRVPKEYRRRNERVETSKAA